MLVEFMAKCLTYCFDFTQYMGYPSYGIAIILLTVIIKLLMAPLIAKQVRSMKNMAKLQPRMRELQEKHKNNRQKLNEEMQKLYQETGVNPITGCLPLLLQMPFLIAIFYALKEYPYIPQYESFLWMPNLGLPDPLYILPVVSALSTYFVSRQTAAKDNNPQQKIMLIGMPLFIGYISLNFPAGLVIYWAVSNIFQYFQQLIMFRGEKE